MPSAKCAICEKWVHKIKGRVLRVDSQEDATRYSLLAGKTVTPGGVVCGKCRVQFPKRTDRRNRNERAIARTETGYESTDDELIEIGLPTPASGHGRCLRCNATNELRTIPFKVRQIAFTKANIIIREGSRVCSNHVISRDATPEQLNEIPMVAEVTSIAASDLEKLMGDAPRGSLFDRMGLWELSDQQLKVFTSLSRNEFETLQNSLRFLKNSRARSASQALFVFLVKMRTGLSDEKVAGFLELPCAQRVSAYFNSVADAFRLLVGTDFGATSLSREDLVRNTSTAARELLNLREDQVVLIVDGTYHRHQKSSNNSFQRDSYSGQKKVPLCKPFTICTTNGFVVDFAGPYYGTENDSTIVKKVLRSSELCGLLKHDDIFIVDRGFRDAIDDLKSLGFRVLMPAMRANRKQVPADEANESRRVTKLRWVVEAVHGVVKQKFRLLHNTLDNKLLPKVKLLWDVAGYLHNRYGRRVWASDTMTAEQIRNINLHMETVNELGEQVEKERWGKRPTTCQKISSADLNDFPKLTEQQLLILITGPYQLKLARSYLAELMDEHNNVAMMYVKEAPNIVRLDIRSRHVKRQVYRVYIDYEARRNDIGGIRRYWCECPNGKRTAGCCAHVATAIYYLSCARHSVAILRPAAYLSGLFSGDGNDTEPEEEFQPDA